MDTNQEILDLIYKFTDQELNQLKEFIQFIKFKRIINKNHTKEDLLIILRENGIVSFEEFAKRIKTEIPYTRSSYNYILGHDLRKWITVTFKVTEDQSIQLINTLIDIGLLRNSGLGNYK